MIFAGAVYGIYKLSSQNPIPEIGESFSTEGRDHVADGTKVEYKTNPPTSGSHYAIPSNWGIIGHEIPDEAAVHNLEHGGVWISYKPDISDSAKKKLEEIAKSGGGKILMTPRAKNDRDLAAVSWGRVYKFDLNQDGSFDESAVKNFIKKYKNTGPEQVPDNMPGKAY